MQILKDIYETINNKAALVESQICWSIVILSIPNIEIIKHISEKEKQKQKMLGFTKLYK